MPNLINDYEEKKNRGVEKTHIHTLIRNKYCIMNTHTKYKYDA